MRNGTQVFGALPPIVLATLRKKMVDLSVAIAEGAVWANASRSHMAESLSHIPREKRDGSFFIGDMIPTCIDDDKEAAAAVCRRTLTGYVTLPNYRNYWKEAGYVEEMEAVEKALAAGTARPPRPHVRPLARGLHLFAKKDIHEGSKPGTPPASKPPCSSPPPQRRPDESLRGNARSLPLNHRVSTRSFRDPQRLS
jgi:hypothetical protein